MAQMLTDRKIESIAKEFNIKGDIYVACIRFDLLVQRLGFIQTKVGKFSF